MHSHIYTEKEKARMDFSLQGKRGTTGGCVFGFTVKVTQCQIILPEAPWQTHSLVTPNPAIILSFQNGRYRTQKGAVLT